MAVSYTHLYAKWAAPVYTVSFDSNGGTPVEQQEVEGGKTASRPAGRMREVYTFAGWYKDAGCAGSSYDFEGKPVSADITLHAKWVPVTVTSYTVRYLIKDTGEALFDEVVRPGNVGAAVFATAKSHSDYVADALSQSIKLEAAASQNVITFWYSKPSDLGYTVKFVDEEGALLAEYTGAPVSSTQIVVRASDYTIPAGYQVTNPIYTLRLQGEDVYKRQLLGLYNQYGQNRGALEAARNQQLNQLALQLAEQQSAQQSDYNRAKSESTADYTRQKNADQQARAQAVADWDAQSQARLQSYQQDYYNGL